jgi:hypothetical protein
MRSGIASLLATTALLGAVACSSSDSSTGPRNNKNPVGTYALFQVDQKSIPGRIFRGPMTFPGGDSYDDFVFTITGEMILQDGGDIQVAIDYKAAADGDSSAVLGAPTARTRSTASRSTSRPAIMASTVPTGTASSR